MPPIYPPMEDNLVDNLASCNPKTYCRSYNLMELEEWIREIKRIFVVLEVPQEKRVNIAMFSLVGKQTFGGVL